MYVSKKLLLSFSFALALFSMSKDLKADCPTLSIHDVREYLSRPSHLYNGWQATFPTGYRNIEDANFNEPGKEWDITSHPSQDERACTYYITESTAHLPVNHPERYAAYNPYVIQLTQ